MADAPRARYLKTILKSSPDKMINPKSPCLLGLDEDGETVIVFFPAGTNLRNISSPALQRKIDEACANIDN